MLLSPQSMRLAVGSLLILMLSFLANVFVISPVIHTSAQYNLHATFAREVAAATAPTAEVDYNNVLLSNGDPVALLKIPALGINEVVVEGTDAHTLQSGVGHRRDSVLPGQQGLSILMGRAWSYGGPFAKLSTLKAGETFTVYTGQGKSTYKVTGIRHAGDPGLTSDVTAGSHLVLMTATGTSYMPNGVLRVDAELVGTPYTAGVRFTPWESVGAADRELGIDTNYTWLLMFCLQLLVVLEVGAVWSMSRVGFAKTWLVFTPAFILALVLTMDQATRLLPNLL